MPLEDAASGAVSAFGGQTGQDVLRQEKITWYREVLALEPGSKVFLPFARLLADMGREDEAVTVLQAGLERHPEYIEARLFFIDLLHRAGRRTQCGAEVARLAGLFREYPGFWEAWGSLEQADGKPDFSVSLNVLGAMFRNCDVTFVDVLSAGLQALQHDGAVAADASPLPGSLGAGPSAVPAGAVADAPAENLAENLEAALDARPDAPADRPSALARQTSPVGAPVAAGDSRAEGVSSGGKCSLRTRSMAEVLAEQGDVAGAIDIYEELLSTCEPVDRQTVQSRLEDLRARLGSMASVDPTAPSGTMGPVGAAMPSASAPARKLAAPRSGVVDLLEKLAVRLEKKARA